jgi:hypothetical protein
VFGWRQFDPVHGERCCCDVQLVQVGTPESDRRHLSTKLKTVLSRQIGLTCWAGILIVCSRVSGLRGSILMTLWPLKIATQRFPSVSIAIPSGNPGMSCLSNVKTALPFAGSHKLAPIYCVKVSYIDCRVSSPHRTPPLSVSVSRCSKTFPGRGSTPGRWRC